MKVDRKFIRTANPVSWLAAETAKKQFTELRDNGLLLVP